MNWLSLALRWVHIVAAITAVGGTIFMRFALLPAVQSLTDEARKALHEQIRARWSMVVRGCILFLLISGFTNFFLFMGETRTAPWAEWKASYNGLYNMMFGTKVLIALAIFFIAEAVVGKAEVFKPIRQNAKMWLSINVILALLVVALSGVMRITHVGPTLPSTSAVTSTESK
jgi:uncharacterized membrane protein